MLIETRSARTVPDQAAVLSDDNALPPISQLPTELLIAILRLVLPRMNSVLRDVFYRSHIYMVRLYTIRSVTKRWRRLIDGTPSFWTIIISTLPPHLNGTSIRRSNDLPLSVVYDRPMSASATTPQSAREFLKSIAHTRQRWSAVALDYGTNISEYIGVPAPLLQTIVARKHPFTPQREPLELLGGETRNLRHVDLTSVSIYWRTGGMARLRCLALDSVSYVGLTGNHLLDILRASPSLQVLKLHNIRTDTPPPSPLITLHQLWCIDFERLAIDLVYFIMRQIRAPSCTNLRIHLRIGDQQEFDVPRFIDEIMSPFNGILLAIHKEYGESEIRFDSCGFSWHTGNGPDADLGLTVAIVGVFDPLCIGWVDRILQNESHLRINFCDGAPLDVAVLGSVARMRCATKLLINGSQPREDVLPILKLLGQPLETGASLPSLPCLQELRITSVGWSSQDLLDMVQSRFCGLSWNTMERTSLSIGLERRAFSRAGVPQPIVELAALGKIREIHGVRCIELADANDCDGMLAVKWDEQSSRPAWGGFDL